MVPQSEMTSARFRPPKLDSLLYFLRIFHPIMPKRPNLPGEGTTQSTMKKRAVLQDDGGQQGSDVDMDTLPTQEPSPTDAQLGPSTSQMASHVVSFEAADNPASKIMEDQQQPGERLSLDEEVLECISWGDREEGRADLLPVILGRIARQAGNEISINEALDLLGNESLQLLGTLTKAWESRSFEHIRCLGECHLYLFDHQICVA